MSKTRIKMEDGTTLTPAFDTLVHCEVHGVDTTWGELNWIQQLAVGDGLDSAPDLPCLLLKRAAGHDEIVPWEESMADDHYSLMGSMPDKWAALEAENARLREKIAELESKVEMWRVAFQEQGE